MRERGSLHLSAIRSRRSVYLGSLLAAIAALVTIAGCGSAQMASNGTGLRRDTLRIADLSAREEAVIYYSAYQFSQEYHFEFRVLGTSPPRVISTQLRASKALDQVIARDTVIMHPNDYLKLDRVLDYYRGPMDFGCPIEDHIEVVWYRGKEKVATEIFIDSSCNLEEGEMFFPLWRLGGQDRTNPKNVHPGG